MMRSGRPDVRAGGAEKGSRWQAARPPDIVDPHNAPRRGARALAPLPGREHLKRKNPMAAPLRDLPPATLFRPFRTVMQNPTNTLSDMQLFARPSPPLEVPRMSVHQPEHLDDCNLPIDGHGFDQQITQKRIERRVVPLRVSTAGIQRVVVESQSDVLHQWFTSTTRFRSPRRDWSWRPTSCRGPGRTRWR